MCVCAGSDEKDIERSVAMCLFVYLVGFDCALGSVHILSICFIFWYCAFRVDMSCKRLLYYV